MKLLICTKCSDTIKLSTEEVRYCECRETSGRYLSDGLYAWYEGEHAIPIGIANGSLVDAIKNQPEAGLGEIFTAFVIPKSCPTMKKVDSNTPTVNKD